MSAPIIYSGALFIVRDETWFTFNETKKNFVLHIPSEYTARPKRRRTWTDEAMRECLTYMKQTKVKLILAGSNAKEVFERVKSSVVTKKPRRRV